MIQFYHKLRQFYFRLITLSVVFIAGCATGEQSGEKPIPLHDIEGNWIWTQDHRWHGNFILEKDGDTYTGTLNDTFEGTYGDRITDVELSGDNIKFTRDGRSGIQYWQGTLKVEDDILKIIDGKWEKEGGFSSGNLWAQKGEDESVYEIAPGFTNRPVIFGPDEDIIYFPEPTPESLLFDSLTENPSLMIRALAIFHSCCVIF